MTANHLYKYAIWLIFASLAWMAGCGERAKTQWSAQGIVRSVWCHPEVMASTCDVIFEHDSGPLQTLTFYGRDVPLWVGLHAKINYHSTQGDVSGLDWVERIRLPDGLIGQVKQ